MMHDVHGQLNAVLPWQKQPSTTNRLFSSANKKQP